MSRSGYSDNCENIGLWRGAVDRAIAGKRGQAFLREMAAALDAMPVKELIADDIVRDDKHVCALGSVALARRMSVSGFDVTDAAYVGQEFGIARALAAEIAYENDERGDRWRDGKWVDETPAARWTRMRRWVEEQIRPRSPEAVANLMRKLDAK
jgi:hypothetical protein